MAPELRTQKRSPAIPRIKAFPLVAPYKATLPMITFSSALNGELTGGAMISLPPDNPLPK